MTISANLSIPKSHGRREKQDEQCISKIDALFVIHSETSIESIKLTCFREGFRSVMLLTTHQMFSTEQELVRAISESTVIFPFVAFLNDLEMEECDNKATRECQEKFSGSPSYFGRFMERSVYYKNSVAFENLLNRYRPVKLYFSVGLGVSEGFWRKMGAAPIESVEFTVEPIPRSRVRWKALKSLSREISVIGDHEAKFVFFGTLKRLGLRAEARPRQGAFLLSKWGWSLGYRAPGLAAWLLKMWLHCSGGKHWSICTTIHEYLPRLSWIARKLNHELFIFVDGHHPSNYPRSYLDQYGPATFVSADVISARWFKKYKRRVCGPFSFQQPPVFTPCKTTEVDTVLLAMNHAGDWSALINRSDSDRLIGAFVELARAVPSLNFIIRLHPTMTHPDHEGVHSMNRVVEYVEQSELPNLKVSDVLLREDLSRAQLCLSEYSQVLIDSWRKGMLGFGVNLTGRRSFLLDYEELGFPVADDWEELRLTIETLPLQTVNLARRQNEAIEKLRRLQIDWETANQSNVD